jgi:hypothetical protein
LYDVQIVEDGNGGIDAVRTEETSGKSWYLAIDTWKPINEPK